MHRSSIARLRLVTDAASEPLSVSDALAYARIDDTGESTAVTQLIKAARRRVEQETGLALMTQTWTAVFDRWPGNEQNGLATPWWDGVRDGPITTLLAQSAVLEIPKRPFQAVTNFQLRDAYGTMTTVDSSIYQTEQSDYRGRIIRKLGAVWPIVIMAPSSGIEITFTAGFDASPYSGVPDDLVFAMKILVKHWYDSRDLLNQGRAIPTPHLLEDVLGSWRNMRLA